MQLVSLSPAEIAPLTPAFVEVYRGAFAGPPYHRQEHEAAEFGRGLPLQANREGFRCLAVWAEPVVVGQDEGARSEMGQHRGTLVGFAYGYRSRPGQWWYDNVARALGPGATKLWLSDAFQLTEIAVLPEYQGQGIGAFLHDQLLSNLAYSRAVLSTLDAETRGYALYRSRGWDDLLSGFHFPGVARPYRIMGRVLTDGAG